MVTAHPITVVEMSNNHLIKYKTEHADYFLSLSASISSNNKNNNNEKENTVKERTRNIEGLSRNGGRREMRENTDKSVVSLATEVRWTVRRESHWKKFRANF
jgi:ribosomal protein L3